MRQIDNMDDSEIEMLRVKNMISTLSFVDKALGLTPKIDEKRVSIQHSRIDACDTLLDYLHDDVAWKDQQPLKGQLETLKRLLEDEMEDGLTP